jgi:hypothetical protein
LEGIEDIEKLRNYTTWKSLRLSLLIAAAIKKDYGPHKGSLTPEMLQASNYCIGVPVFESIFCVQRGKIQPSWIGDTEPKVICSEEDMTATCI